jgi:hypothetical protein
MTLFEIETVAPGPLNGGIELQVGMATPPRT